MSYDYLKYDDHYDPEVEDAVNNHGQPPTPVSEYYEGITPHRCTTRNCGVFIYESLGMFYDYNTGIAHTCITEENTNQFNQTLAKECTTMNNIKVTSFPSHGISAHSLKVGEYARVVGTVLKPYFGDIVLKTSKGVVNLTDPNTVWDVPLASPFVERLNTGDKLEITVGFTTDFEDRIRREAQSNKIMAIKAVREATNWGLKESKEYVESLLLKF